MSNTDETSPADDARRRGPDEHVRRDPAAEGNVAAFRPKPARHPDSLPPLPPTAA